MKTSLYVLLELSLVYITCAHFPLITGRKKNPGPVGRFCIRNSECLSSLCYWARCTEATPEDDVQQYNIKNIFNIDDSTFDLMKESNSIDKQALDKDDGEMLNTVNKAGDIQDTSPISYHRNHRIKDFRKSFNDGANDDVEQHLELIKSSSRGITRIPLHGIFLPLGKFEHENFEHHGNRKYDFSFQ